MTDSTHLQDEHALFQKRNAALTAHSREKKRLWEEEQLTNSLQLAAFLAEAAYWSGEIQKLRDAAEAERQAAEAAKTPAQRKQECLTGIYQKLYRWTKGA